MHRIRHFLGSLALLACASGTAQAYTGLYIFGDSLSDTGNNALVIDALLGGARTPVPIPNAFTGGGLVARLPFQASAPVPGLTFDRYSNGRIWVEPFALGLGLNLGARPSRAGGTNFAYGGAEIGPIDPTGTVFPPSLLTQSFGYLQAATPADPNGLYVVAGGGNDARDTLGDTIGGFIRANGDVIDNTVLPSIQSAITAAATGYASGIGQIVGGLKQAGAGDIIVWNVPDLGIIPETLIAGAGYTASGGAPTYAQLGTTLADAMNDALQLAVGNVAGVKVFDLFGVLQGAVAGSAFANVTEACAASAACIAGQTGPYLFWDGIHPTSAGHQMLAEAMLAAVPEPETYAMMVIGVVLVGWQLRRRARREFQARIG